MFVEGQVLKRERNESKKVEGKFFHSIKVLDDTLRTNEGVVSVDVSAEQYEATEEGGRVRFDIAFCEYREALHRISYVAAKAQQGALFSPDAP